MRAKILIAEDEPFIIESLRFLLEREGYSVAAVTDGTAVLGRVQREPPDLLILDIMLPEMSGFEILRRLRTEPTTARLPVLVLSAKGQAADHRRMEDFGADDYVTKPFANKELLERVARLVERLETAGGTDGR